jgi:hypothetical protein
MVVARTISGQRSATGTSMGDLISLPIRKRPTRPPENGDSAQILFFTGVRYQRMVDVPLSSNNGTRPSSEGGAGAKRKRKRG